MAHRGGREGKRVIPSRGRSRMVVVEKGYHANGRGRAGRTVLSLLGPPNCRHHSARNGWTGPTVTGVSHERLFLSLTTLGKRERHQEIFEKRNEKGPGGKEGGWVGCFTANL